MNPYITDRIFRGARRKLGLLPKRSSYPLISGDTYRTLCDLELTEETFFLITKVDLEIEANFFLGFQHYDKFIKFLKLADLKFLKRSKLFIHNGDANYLIDDIKLIMKVFSQLYAVNWNGTFPNVFPIPIGLENQSVLMNGVKKDFQKLIEIGLKPFEERSIGVLVSFNEKNNPILRNGLHDKFKNFTESYIPNRFVSSREYRELICNSRYIISPPGNGIDCHRTWEAIYLGAIPIVLDKYWAFTKFRLPVIPVMDWDAAMVMIEDNIAKEQIGCNRVFELKKMFLDEIF